MCSGYGEGDASLPLRRGRDMTLNMELPPTVVRCEDALGDGIFKATDADAKVAGRLRTQSSKREHCDPRANARGRRF